MSKETGIWSIVASRSYNISKRLTAGFEEATANLKGASYIPLLYCGFQIVNGVNYCIIARQKLSDEYGDTHLVKMIINEAPGKLGYRGDFTLVSIETLI